MALCIRQPELVGVTETSITLSFEVADGPDGPPVAEPAHIRVGDRTVDTAGRAGTRLVRVEDLTPATRYPLGIHVGDVAAEHDRYLPPEVTTLPAAEGGPVATFATLNDLHFGEEYFGGTLDDEWEYGPEKPGWPAVKSEDYDEPYWRFMNEDVIDDINAATVQVLNLVVGNRSKVDLQNIPAE